MFLPINTQKTYLNVNDCLDGLKGQKLHDISLQITQARNEILKQMQQSTNRKRVLAEEMSQNIDEFLEAKHSISKRFQKQVFNLIDSKKIEQECEQHKIVCIETDEVKDDFKQLHDLIKSTFCK
ncbi:unnamed protein product [Paramecium primaurelia]|uniref:Uncharacterized protein n=2 Tax=Paramecium TaxID=5884 RepID=A0A8S1XDB8_9CILI|nr:unnamed protein product [Paramecium primaurelia]CAD8198929.1 unnamed protein product [Paramecium pentaurelia]